MYPTQWLALALVAVGGAASAQPQRLVAVADGTPVYSSKEAREPELVLPQKSSDPFLFEWVATHGDRTEVRTLNLGDVVDTHVHCGDRPQALRGLELTLFVPTASLRSAVTRRVEKRFDDGSGFVLLPGQVVEPLGKGRFRVPTSLARVEVELPSDAIGQIFVSEGKTFRPRSTVPTEFTTDAATPLLLAGRPLEDVRTSVLAVLMMGKPKTVELDRRVSKGIYEHATACMKLELAVPDEKVNVRELATFFGKGGLNGYFPKDSSEKLPAGTEVFFRNGARAGKTVDEVRIARDRARRSPKNLRCVHLEGAGEPRTAERPFVFCVARR